MFTFLKLMVALVLSIAIIVVLFGVVTVLAGVAWFFAKLALVLVVALVLYWRFVRSHRGNAE